jgi:transposase-like protein
MRFSKVHYDDALAEVICGKVAQGFSLRLIARQPGMPSSTTLTEWLGKRPAFRTLYEQARARRPKLIRDPNPPGRLPPDLRSGYTRKKAQAVCERIAAGASMNQLAQDHGVPGLRTLYVWLNEREEFRDLYRAACDARADRLIDEATAIADDPDGDVQRDRLRIDVRKWRLSITEPRRHGRKDAPDTPREKTHEEWLDELE